MSWSIVLQLAVSGLILTLGSTAIFALFLVLERLHGPWQVWRYRRRLERIREAETAELLDWEAAEPGWPLPIPQTHEAPGPSRVRGLPHVETRLAAPFVNTTPTHRSEQDAGER